MELSVMRFIGSFMPEQIPVSAGVKEALVAFL